MFLLRINDCHTELSTTYQQQPYTQILNVHELTEETEKTLEIKKESPMPGIEPGPPG